MKDKILVLGASGMVGYKLFDRMSAEFAVTGVVRGPREEYAAYKVFAGRDVVYGVDVRDEAALRAMLVTARPAVVINCCGVIKQVMSASADVDIIRLNALLPHQLAAMAEELGFRLIHISTDCVFSGKKGAYTETDTPDPVDFYGRSKLLGEVVGKDVLTLRTSFVGPEIHRKKSLLEWFLSQTKGPVKGYRRAIYSGLTTDEFSAFVASVVSRHRDLQGLYHVASEPITKYDLLVLFAREYSRKLAIEADDKFVCDRSLDASAIRTLTGYEPPSWKEMVRAMASA